MKGGKKIDGFGGRYKINKEGQVWCKKKKRYVSIITSNNYCTVRLVDGKTQNYYSLARLLAFAFLPPPKPKQILKWVNGDRTDNSLENIVWADRKTKPPKPKKTKSKKAAIGRRKVFNQFFGLPEASNETPQVVIKGLPAHESEYNKAMEAAATYVPNTNFFIALCQGRV